MARKDTRNIRIPMIFVVLALVIIPFLAPFFSSETTPDHSALAALFVISPAVVLLGGVVDGWINSYDWFYCAVVGGASAISALVFYTASVLLTVPYFVLFAVLGNLLAAFIRSQMRTD